MPLLGDGSGLAGPEAVRKLGAPLSWTASYDKVPKQHLIGGCKVAGTHDVVHVGTIAAENACVPVVSWRRVRQSQCRDPVVGAGAVPRKRRKSFCSASNKSCRFPRVGSYRFLLASVLIWAVNNRRTVSSVACGWKPTPSYLPFGDAALIGVRGAQAAGYKRETRA